MNVNDTTLPGDPLHEDLRRISCLEGGVFFASFFSGMSALACAISGHPSLSVCESWAAGSFLVFFGSLYRLSGLAEAEQADIVERMRFRFAALLAPESSVPDGLAVGVCIWRACGSGVDARLQSLAEDVLWPPRQGMTLPSPIGPLAYKTLDSALRILVHRGATERSVVGTAALRGPFFDFGCGWRVAEAYPLSLAGFDSNLVGSLAAVYGCRDASE